MFDNVKINMILTLIIVLVLLFTVSIVTGVNIMSMQASLLIIIGIAALIGVQAILLRMKRKNKDKIIKILISVVVFLVILAIINFTIEFTTNSVLIFRKTIPGVLLFIYVSITLLLLFLLIDRYIKQKRLYIVLQSIVILLIIVLGIYDVVLTFLGGASVTEVEFEEPNITLYLVEDSFLFSTNHRLYKEVLPFYGTYLEHDGSWTCDDGCVTRTPEAYTWTWIDDSTLIVSYSQMFNDVIYYLPEDND